LGGLRRCISVLSAARDVVEVVVLIHLLERVAERRPITRPFAIRAVAGMTGGMITPEAGIGVPVDGSIGADLVGRIARLVEILAVLVLDVCRVSRTICERDPGHA